jgi:hypothetical protein
VQQEEQVKLLQQIMQALSAAAPTNPVESSFLQSPPGLGEVQQTQE